MLDGRSHLPEGRAEPDLRGQGRELVVGEEEGLERRQPPKLRRQPKKRTAHARACHGEGSARGVKLSYYSVAEQ